MNTTTRRAPGRRRPATGRWPATAAVAIGVGYLIWRAGWTLTSTSTWFAVPLFIVEAWAVAQLAVVVAVLGRRRSRAPLVGLGTTPPTVDEIAIVVDAVDTTPDALRRTLVAIEEVDAAASFVVILADEDPVAAAAIARAGGRIRVDATTDRPAAFWAAAVAEDRPFVCWIDAGDIVTPTTLVSLAEHFVDDEVALVQGAAGLINADSFLHLREGHDEAAFERDVLLPALGQAGAAPWLGSGSLCRVGAVAAVGGVDVGAGAREAAVARLHAHGHATHYESTVVVRRTAPDSIDDYLHDRQRQARDRLRRRALALRAPGRLARLALADTHLRSIRQLTAAGLLVVALFSAPVPVAGSTGVWIAVAAIVHGSGAWARHRLAAGTMGRGDWVRQGWRTVGADLAGAANRRAVSTRASSSGVRTLGRLRVATAMLVCLDLAVVARGMTLASPDLLPRFDVAGRFAALGAAVLCIVALIDVMQVVVRRRQRRSDHRIVAPLSAIVDEDYCETLDLSPSGAGLILTEPRAVGSSIEITLAVPRLDGSITPIDLSGTVRHTRPFAPSEDEPARHVVGVEFGDIAPDAWSALFTYCALVHPGGLDRRVDPEPIVGPAVLDIRHSRLQKAMGPISVAAGILAAGTMFFGPGAGAAFASSSLGEARACVVSSDGSARAGGLVKMHADGVWQDIATTDDSGCVAFAIPRTGSVPVQVVLDGRTQRIDQDLAWNPRVVFRTTEVTVVARSSTGDPIQGARVQWYGGQWLDAGATGPDGIVTFETWEQSVPVQVVLDGRTKRIDQNIGWDPRVVFETTEVTAVVQSSAGDPIEGARVQWYGGIWREAGGTGADGTVTFETWDQVIPVQVWLNGRVDRIDQNVGWDARVVFETTEVTAVVQSSAGDPIEGARVEWYGDGWRPAGETGADGTVTFETWDQVIPIQVYLNDRVHRIDQNVGLDPEVTFSTSEVVVEVTASGGEPVAGAVVQWYGGGWRTAGRTLTDGTLRFETWAQTIPVQVTLDGRTQRKDQNVATTPLFGFATVPLPDEIAAETTEYHNGQWRILRPGDEFLPGSLLLRRSNGSTHTYTVAAALPEPEPEPEPTPLPDPTAVPTTQPDSTPEPTPVPIAEAESDPQSESPDAETPTAQPTPTATAAEGSAPLTLDLPRADPTPTAEPTPTAPAPAQSGQPPATGSSVAPPSDTDAPPPADPTAPPFDAAAPAPVSSSDGFAGGDDDGLVVFIRPIAPSSDTVDDDTMAFDLEVTNQGARRAEAPVVVDVDLGSSLTPTTVDSETWRCSHDADSLRCISADPLDPGDRSTIALTARAPEGTDGEPTDLAMAADSSIVSVTTGDEIGAVGTAAGTAPVATAPTVRVVIDGRSSPTDTLIVALLLAIAVGIWSSRIRRGKAAA